MPFAGYDMLIAAILATWFACTIRFHVPLADNLALRRRDLFGIVPDWRFFAPTPAKLDYHLLYRDRLADGTATDWTEVSVTPARRWYCCLWNPFRRDRKALFDLTTEIARIAVYDGARYVPGSVAYLALLSYISALPRLPGSIMTQFCLMASDPSEVLKPPEPVIVSDTHWLETYDA
jgi:hypothetical protein